MGTGKFVQIPQGANKESHLYKYPNLIKSDAPKLKYTQEGKIDTCVSKAFASVLHYAGYTEIASNINGKFFSKKEVYVCSEPNYTAILAFATPKLPKWLQLCRKRIDKMRWDTDINQYDIFVAGVVGTDGVANHAIAIYNNWVFDANEKIALPLCKEALDYCVSTKDQKFEFVKFTSGFYYREQGNKLRLKRQLEEKIVPSTVACRKSFYIKKKQNQCQSSSKVSKI